MTLSVEVEVQVVLSNPSGSLSTVIHCGLLCQYEYLANKMLVELVNVVSQ